MNIILLCMKSIVHQFLLTFQKKVPKKTEEAIEGMYAVVNKRRKSQISEEEKAPPIPPHTVEELYAAVNKTPDDNATEKVPPIPSHTLESLYTAVKKVPISDYQEDKDCKP